MNDVTNIDSKALGFLTFCISMLSVRLRMSKPDVYNRLKRSGILYGYIVPCYDVLHTFSLDYLLDDLTTIMQEKGVLKP